LKNIYLEIRITTFDVSEKTTLNYINTNTFKMYSLNRGMKQFPNKNNKNIHDVSSQT